MKTIRCPTCDGDCYWFAGAEEQFKIACEQCHGLGEIEIDDDPTTASDCWNCGGSGGGDGYWRCPTCHGSGQTKSADNWSDDID